MTIILCRHKSPNINDKKQMLDELLQKVDDGIVIQNKLKKALKKNNSNMVIVSLQAKMKAITTYIDNYPDLGILYFYKGEMTDSMNIETQETDTVKIINKSIEWLEAMKQAAKDRGVSKREIYAALLEAEQE
mgnify:CR=1 FL=1